jgi:amidohydrolase
LAERTLENGPAGQTPPLIREVSATVERLAPALLELSHRIHANPELGHEERQASAWCAELLREHGFEVTAPFGGLETAFRARGATAASGSMADATDGPVRPTIAFLAEYDALPGIGHACGHNIIAASAVGAGVTLVRSLEKLAPALRATILVDGTPAEETVGGKIPLVEQGLYRDVDAALSLHPYARNSAGSTCLGVKRMTFTFRGRSAHAAADPEKGINALDAVIQTFNNVNGLRQHVRPDVRLHGIVTHGGGASNIVPDFAQAVFSVRSADMDYFTEVVGKVKACARGAALATGATLDITENQTYSPIRRNRTLTRLALETMAAVGLEAEDAGGTWFPASTDFGNVSQVTPAIAPLFKVGSGDAVLHHMDFAVAAASSWGDAVVLTAAKVLAIVGARLVLEPETLRAARADFASPQ